MLQRFAVRIIEPTMKTLEKKKKKKKKQSKEKKGTDKRHFAPGSVLVDKGN